jgi:L-serine dehydratase
MAAVVPCSLGLEGAHPEPVDVSVMEARVAQIRATRELKLVGRHAIRFQEPVHLLYFRKPLPHHPNGMRFEARDAAGEMIDAREYFSVGGGFVADARTDNLAETSADKLPYPYPTGDELLALSRETGLPLQRPCALQRGCLSFYR